MTAPARSPAEVDFDRHRRALERTLQDLRIINGWLLRVARHANVTERDWGSLRGCVDSALYRLEQALRRDA